MAIPPIIANNPILKLFKTEPSSGSKTDVAKTPQTPEDIVEISEAAQQHLDGIRDLSKEGADKVQEVAGETRGILEGDESLTLGADPAFDS